MPPVGLKKVFTFNVDVRIGSIKYLMTSHFWQGSFKDSVIPVLISLVNNSKSYCWSNEGCQVISFSVEKRTTNNCWYMYIWCFILCIFYFLFTFKIFGFFYHSRLFYIFIYVYFLCIYYFHLLKFTFEKFFVIFKSK